MPPDTAVILPHTHWDREWYLPFEGGFQPLLIQLMDDLLDLLDGEREFAHFHLDGQAAMLDDYLDARPQRTADIRRLASAGRLSIGPWYTQLDEFLTSGESHIRNLEVGLARAADLGARATPVGYLPDQFGHIGQMPQIMGMFGIERAVVWRGVPSAIDRDAFRWEAPDGSSVVAEYLIESYTAGEDLRTTGDPEVAAADIASWVARIAPHATRDRVLLPLGGDHRVPGRQMPAVLSGANGIGSVRAHIGSLAEHVSGPPPPNLQTWRGELRSGARANLLPNVYSTRVHQKLERGRLEWLVERCVEPLAALVGSDWPADDLARIWKLLLQNGAHDSVCGCSVDAVAEAVDERHREVRELAERLVGGSLAELAGHTADAGTLRFNPSPFEREGIPGLGWSVVDAPEPPAEGVDLGFRLVVEPDIGDLYTFCPAPFGEPVEVEDSDYLGLAVSLRCTRRADEEFVRVTGTIRNARPDHRLRLHVPLAFPAQGSVAAAPFELVQRPVTSEGGFEAPSRTWPATGAVYAGGSAVLGEGVFEYEVIEGRTLAITLLRCTGSISRPSGMPTRWASAGPLIAAPGGQMLGEWEVSLGIWPNAELERLLEMRERFALPLLMAPAPGGGDLPAAGTLLELEGAQLSSVRRREGALEVRVWNPSTEHCRARVGSREIELGPATIMTVRP